MSNILPAGTPAPDFTLHATPDKMLVLKGLRGRPAILAFYPADWSPELRVPTPKKSRQAFAHLIVFDRDAAVRPTH